MNHDETIKRIQELEAKMDNPKTPQGEIKTLGYELSELKRQQKIKEREHFEKKNKINVYGSDDSVGCSAGAYSFYYGYEATKCPKHKSTDICGEEDCEQEEWCFTVDKDGNEIIRWAKSEFSYPEADSIERILIIGICKFIKEVLSKDNFNDQSDGTKTFIGGLLTNTK